MSAAPHGPRRARPRSLIVPRPVARPATRLFCFPYAGGSASAYRGFGAALPADVEAVAIELPGRGARFTEPTFRHLGPLLAALADDLGPFLDVPFAFFGHSMGGLIAFELARLLRRRGGPQPARLFLSSCPAPGTRERPRPLHTLPDAELVEEMRGYGGLGAEVLGSPELLELLLPMIRADFEVVDTWVSPEEAPLEIPIATLHGTSDTVSRAQAEAWRAHTRGPFAVHVFPGNHFYLREQEREVVLIISRALARPAHP